LIDQNSVNVNPNPLSVSLHLLPIFRDLRLLLR
jgi:hypothetical protein